MCRYFRKRYSYTRAKNKSKAVQRYQIKTNKIQLRTIKPTEASSNIKLLEQTWIE